MSSFKFYVILILVLLFGCKKQEYAEVNSGVATFGNGRKVHFVDILEHPAGGYVLGANTMERGSWDYWVLRLDEDFSVIWEKHLGGFSVETLQKLFIDRNHNILLSGISRSVDQDSSLMVAPRDLIYTVLLNPNGQELWYRTDPWEEHPTYGFFKLPDRQFVLDLLQNEAGEYVVACNMGHVNSEPDLTTFTSECTLMKLSANGDLLSIGSQYDIWPRAFFNLDTTYYFYGRAYSSFSNYGFYAFDPQNFDGSNTSTNQYLKSGSSDFQGLYIYKAERSYRTATGYLDYVFNIDGTTLYRASLNSTNGEFTTDSYEMEEGKLQSLGRNPEGNYLLNFQNGTQQELNRNFEVIHTFHLDWKPSEIFRLSDGTYLGVKEQSGKFLVMRFNNEGDVLE